MTITPEAITIIGIVACAIVALLILANAWR